MKIKVEVTQKHIDTGIKRATNACPIALALIDCGFENPYVGTSCIFVDHMEMYRPEVVVPNRVKKFISDFDDDIPVKPIEFEAYLQK